MSKEVSHSKYSIIWDNKSHKAFKENKFDSGILCPYILILSIKKWRNVFEYARTYDVIYYYKEPWSLKSLEYSSP